MNKRPLVFMALIVLSGIMCGLHDINRMVKTLSVFFILYVALQKKRDCRHRSFFFYLKVYLLYIILFLSGYIRADIEYDYFNTAEAIEFFNEYAPSNPGEFDYAQYLKAKRIRSKEMLDNSKNKENFLKDVRKYALDKISRSFNSEDAGILRAMLIGDKTEMSPELKKLYQDAGISHIISISGLHISLAGMSFFMILKKLNAGIGKSLFGASIFTFFYGILTGNAVSTVRAVIMIIIKYMGTYLGRGYDMITAIAVSALIIVFFRPYMLLEAGFQLSFAAVIAISCISGAVIKALSLYLDREPGKIASAFIVCMSVQLMSFPILAYHFFEINLSSVVLNMLIVPLAGFVIYSGTAVIFGGMASDLLQQINLSSGKAYMLLGAPAHYILSFFKGSAGLWDTLPLSSVRTGRPEEMQMVFYYAALFIVVIYLKSYCTNRKPGNKKSPGNNKGSDKRGLKSKKNGKNRFLPGITALLLLFAFAPFILKRPYSDKLKIINLDVGQGDSCIILEGKRSLMIDGGSSSNRDIYEAVIDKSLGFYGIDRLDAVIVSHADADHVNGIEAMLEDTDIDIGMLILPKPAQNHEKYQRLIRKYDKAEGKEPVYLKTGDVLHIGERLNISCIQEGTEDENDVNRHSSFLLISYGDFSMLSSGDAVARDEIRAALGMEKELAGKSLSFFKAGHHGSGGSNAKELIDAIKPQYVFFSCDRKNRYGHPDREVVDYCMKKGAACLCSFSSGAVIVECDKASFKVQEFKKTKALDKPDD